MRTCLAVLAAAVLAGGLAADEPKKPWDQDLPAAPRAGKDDSAEVKAAKAIMAAELERFKLIQNRIAAGQFSGGKDYLQFGEAVRGLTDASEDAYPEPKDRLPWYEYRLKVADDILKFNAPRVKNGVEEPQLLPQLEAEVARAELALLKLKKKLK